MSEVVSGTVLAATVEVDWPVDDVVFDEVVPGDDAEVFEMLDDLVATVVVDRPATASPPSLSAVSAVSVSARSDSSSPSSVMASSFGASTVDWLSLGTAFEESSLPHPVTNSAADTAIDHENARTFLLSILAPSTQTFDY